VGIFRRKETKSGRHRGTDRPSDVKPVSNDAALTDGALTTGDASVGDEDGVASEPIEEGAPLEQAGTDQEPGTDSEPDEQDELQEPEPEVLETPSPVTRRTGPVDRSEGPFDESEVDGPGGRLDLGALWLPARAGMELRVEVDQENQTIVGLTAALGQSAVQLQAFAAPKSSGIWDEVRREIADSIVGQGGTAEEVDGPLGAELQTRMPGRGPDGRTVFSPVRFLGVDGPRWFLRAVLSGRAGSDVDAAAELIDLVKETVVVRGPDAMAPRELLGLQLPAEVTDQDEQDEKGEHGAEDPAAPDSQDGGKRDTDDLNPFERGPEITEIR
jgi:hypothetical protein